MRRAGRISLGLPPPPQLRLPPILLLALALSLAAVPAWAGATYDLTCENVAKITILRFDDPERMVTPEGGRFYNVHFRLTRPASEAFDRLSSTAPNRLTMGEEVIHVTKDLDVTANGRPLRDDTPFCDGLSSNGPSFDFRGLEDALAAARAVCPEREPRPTPNKRLWETPPEQVLPEPPRQPPHPAALPSELPAPATFEVSCANVTRIRILRAATTWLGIRSPTGFVHILVMDLTDGGARELERALGDAPVVHYLQHGMALDMPYLVLTANGVPLPNAAPESIGAHDHTAKLAVIHQDEAFDAARAICPALTPDKVLEDGEAE